MFPELSQIVQGSLTNLDTFERVPFLYNPETIKHTINVGWTRQTVPGLSHERSQYLNTKNVPYTFTLVFDAIELGTPAKIEDYKLLLKSFCYPRKDRRIEGAGPAKLLFVFPNVYSVKGHIERLDFEDLLFYSSGAVRRFSVAVTFVEEPEERIDATKVKAQRRVARNTVRIDFSGAPAFQVNGRNRTREDLL